MQPGNATVLVVAASAVVRRAVARALGADSAFCDTETAGSDSVAWARLSQRRPDLIVLDWDLPPGERLPFLERVHQHHASVPVIAFGVALVWTTAGDAARPLPVGTSAFLERPPGADRLEEWSRGELLPKLKAALVNRSAAADRATEPAPRSSVPAASTSQVTPSRVMLPWAMGPHIAPHQITPAELLLPEIVPAEIVVVAASTGGPEALTEVLTRLPETFRCPIVIVQHMPSGFTGTLAGRLASRTGRKTREAELHAPLTDAEIWIAPGGRHLEVERFGLEMRLVLQDEPPENGCRPAADVLFRSVAAGFGRASLAVVLTGMGQDGALGCAAIRAKGGQILVQDKASSVIWSMPGAVSRAGLADCEFSVEQLGLEIARRCRH